MAFNVAIRTISVREDRLEIGVGGGIVWDSEATSEYNECLLKSRFLTDPHEPFRLIETIRWNEATGFSLLERHLARLMRSSRYFGYCFDRDGIVRHLSQVMNGLAGAKRVRLTLGARGDTQVEIADLELHSADHFWRYGIASQRMTSNDWRIYHKTTRRELYDQGLNELKHRFECDEALFLNEREELTEGSRSNLFIERDGVWLTPPLSSGLLDGCLRRDMLEGGDKRVVEQVLQIGDLSQGTVWFGNSLRGLIRGLPSSVK
jgi:para-aminobenzoate synthetase/4-amino-4-deoxychorismate lyase